MWMCVECRGVLGAQVHWCAGVLGAEVCWVHRCAGYTGVLGTQVCWVWRCSWCTGALGAQVRWVQRCVGCGAFLFTCTARNYPGQHHNQKTFVLLRNQEWCRDRGKQSKGKPSPHAFS